MNDTVRVSVPRPIEVDEAAAHRDIDSSIAAGREISPETAVAVASWWQSPGPIGAVLASFASGMEVSRDALLADIAGSRRVRCHNAGMAEHEHRELDALAEFVRRHR
ncbi:hypothetical protein H7J07_05740 [Mycobacterium koreense]|uniref:hypothetical protein n=1 Tax=Mycolicibacillus koreensis TaxID=1069220 RepID=UPI0013D35209|nr:hypothetical protein [Mycolicibacillus koreensis]MCV7247727.1 hypothetical protein [Mycolicibacillus koreensis]